MYEGESYSTPRTSLGGLAGIAPSTPTEPSPGLSLAMTLHQQIGELENAFRVLQNKLKPITRVTDEKLTNEAVAEPSSAPLIREIGVAIYRIDFLRKEISPTISSLEI